MGGGGRLMKIAKVKYIVRIFLLSSVVDTEFFLPDPDLDPD
jgi:hypothetical protein